ncbi:MAG: hypothetical protein AAF430_25790 [Myxococcota bacterium]
MNYFAHAHLALRRCDDAAFVLGSMLPDWQRWVGGRLAAVHHPELAEGVRFHHASDVAFHGSPTFHRLERQAFRALQEAGVGRGPARGVAHVGVEILLDATLLAGESMEAPFAAALDAADRFGAHLEWKCADGAVRFTEVVTRLRARGLPRPGAEPDLAGRGILRTLAPRPRLRVSAEEEPAVLAWARRTRPIVDAARPAMFAETEARLADAEANAPAPAPMS